MPILKKSDFISFIIILLYAFPGVKIFISIYCLSYINSLILLPLENVNFFFIISVASNSFNCGSFFFLPKFPLFFLNQLLLLFLFARVTFARLFYIYLMMFILWNGNVSNKSYFL